MFSLSGAYSGLDVNSMVDALVNAESAPVENRLARKESAANVELSAVGQLKSALEAFQTQLQSMDSADELSPISHTLTDDSVLSAAVSSTAAAGLYTFYVDQLASNHQLISDAIDTSDTVGTGTASFTVNGESFSVTLATGTLTELRDAINDASDNVGVNAAIVNDGGQQRLMLTSESTGAAYGITADFSGLTGGTVSLGALTELEAAQDASIRFGSGVGAVTITSEDNTLENVMDGVSLTLKATSANPQTLEVSRDTAALKTLIEGFVDAWNTLDSTLDTLTDYDGTTAGPLNGDAQARILESQLRREFSALFGDEGDTVRTLGSLGINTSTDGSLSINTTKLDDAINNQYDKLVAAFAQESSATSNVQPLVLSGMTNSDYDQMFVDAGVDGFIASDGDFVSNSTFEMYKYDAGGGNWYIAFYDGATNDWTAATTTSDPATWLSGDAIAFSDNEVFENSIETYDGKWRPNSGDSNVSYLLVAEENGLMHRLNDILSSYLGSDGSLSTRESSINDKLSKVADDRIDLAVRIGKIRTYYQKQFAAMESLLASLSGTSQWLTNNLQNNSSSK